MSEVNSVITLSSRSTIRRETAEKMTEKQFVDFCKKHKAGVDAKSKYKEIQEEKKARIEAEKAKKEESTTKESKKND